MAYYAVNKWLMGFAYKVDIGFTTFVLAGSMVLLISLTAIGYHIISVININPIQQIRYE